MLFSHQRVLETVSYKEFVCSLLLAIACRLMLNVWELLAFLPQNGHFLRSNAPEITLAIFF